MRGHSSNREVFQIRLFTLSFCISRLCMGRYSPSLSVCYDYSATVLSFGQCESWRSRSWAIGAVRASLFCCV